MLNNSHIKPRLGYCVERRRHRHLRGHFFVGAITEETYLILEIT